MKISLTPYSLAYGFGFLKDSRMIARNHQSLTLDNLVELCLNYNAGGLEVPIDKFFFIKNEGHDLLAFIKKLKRKKLSLTLALENFDKDYIKFILPLLKDSSIKKNIRVKISNFYGGNRFENPQLKSHIKAFIKDLEECRNLIMDNNFRILIENHQDISCQNIDDLLERFRDIIGINWDIGNSLPTGLVPEDFFLRYQANIKNIHLKDYLITKVQDGYAMHRCELGMGVVNFKKIFEYCRKSQIDTTFTIELGAHITRIAKIKDPKYWKFSEGVTREERDNLLNLIDAQNNYSPEYLTYFEKGLSPKVIANNELNELIKSINYIKMISP